MKPGIVCWNPVSYSYVYKFVYTTGGFEWIHECPTCLSQQPAKEVQ